MNNLYDIYVLILDPKFCRCYYPFQKIPRNRGPSSVLKSYLKFIWASDWTIVNKSLFQTYEQIIIRDKRSKNGFTLASDTTFKTSLLWHICELCHNIDVFYHCQIHYCTYFYKALFWNNFQFRKKQNCYQLEVLVNWVIPKVHEVDHYANNALMQKNKQFFIFSYPMQQLDFG